MLLTFAACSICNVRRLLVDPRRIYALHVKGRQLVYLDTNAWSELSKGATEAARAAHTLAVEAFDAGRALFPVSNATVGEFLKREVSFDSRRLAVVMDWLSNGVTLRGEQHVRDSEARRAYAFLTGNTVPDFTDQMFTATVCYGADAFMDFPDDCWTDDAADEFMEQLRSRGLPGVSLLPMHMRTPEYLRVQREGDVKYVEDMRRWHRASSDWAADRSGKLNAKKLRAEEYLYAFKRHFCVRIARLMGSEGLERVATEFQMLTGREHARKVSALVEKMPSVSLSAEMHVQTTLAHAHDPQVEEQESYDHEHASMAIPYVDVFVTSDGELFDLLRRARAQSSHGCHFLRGMKGLADFLRGNQ